MNDLFGYFDSPTQIEPTYDPGLTVPCPICLLDLTMPVTTISLMGVKDNKSYFFRAHKSCWYHATVKDKDIIEGSLIDSVSRHNSSEFESKFEGNYR